jgi:hypothetical protein
VEVRAHKIQNTWRTTHKNRKNHEKVLKNS